MGRLTMISCLCVTRRRAALLMRAMDCFRRQTYANRELLIVYEADDDQTRQFRQTCADPADARIRWIEVPATTKLTLGELRNISVAAAVGRYICQWDDDDWYADNRLQEQYKALVQSGKPGVVLSRWILSNGPSYWVSSSYPWEGSILSRKSILKPYPKLAIREDTPMVQEMLRTGLLALLDAPLLYVHFYHGNNTWNAKHFQMLQDLGKPLADNLARDLHRRIFPPKLAAALSS